MRSIILNNPRHLVFGVGCLDIFFTDFVATGLKHPLVMTPPELFPLVKERLSSWTGIARKLSELNISRNDIPNLADTALTVTRLLNNNVRPVTKSDAVMIYERAFD